MNQKSKARKQKREQDLEKKANRIIIAIICALIVLGVIVCATFF